MTATLYIVRPHGCLRFWDVCYLSMRYETSLRWQRPRYPFIEHILGARLLRELKLFFFITYTYLSRVIADSRKYYVRIGG